jgi:hypothetical protein
MVIDRVMPRREAAQAAADAGSLGALALRDDAANTRRHRSRKHRRGAQLRLGELTADGDVIVLPLPFTCPDGTASCIRADAHSTRSKPATRHQHDPDDMMGWRAS